LREGHAPPEILRKGARGELPVGPEECVEILALLASHSEEQTRNEARETLRRWDAHELEQLLTSLPPETLECVAMSVLPEREVLLDLLVEKLTERATHRHRSEGLPSTSSSANAAAARAAQSAAQPGERTDEHHETLLERISRMSVVEKIQAALLGTSEERLMLVRDANKAVARAVLSSPKLTETELEAIASMKTVAEEVLRAIAQNRGFIRHYPVAYALVNNSRAPIDISLPLVVRLNPRDLKALAVNHNVPSALRQAADALCRQKQR
jgi:hypothetical protein